MNKRLWIGTLVSAIVLLIILLWGRPERKGVPSAPPQEVNQPDNASVPSMSIAIQDTASVASTDTLMSVDQKTSATGRSSEAIREYVESQNVPIEFYGRIVDQNTNSVAGAKIQVNVRHWNSINPVPFGAEGRVITIEKETDADGRFEIRDVTGDGFQVESIQKNGYQLSPKAPNHFGPGSGSFENPVIIKMWKEGTKEPLSNGRHVFGIDSDKIYTLDLINGKKIEGEAEGDLQITIRRPTDATPRKNYSWSFYIKAIDGGFADTDPDDEFMYAPPEAGYQPELKMQFDPNSPSWTGVVKKQFYFRSRNGQIYGHAQIEVDAIYNVHSAIQISYTINPAGSRNLQP